MPVKEKPIIFTIHALQRMKERGTDKEAVREAVRIGERETARGGRALYRLNLEFNKEWDVAISIFNRLLLLLLRKKIVLW